MSRRELLVVDDEPNLRRVLQAALEKAGYAVRTAEDGPRALRALAECPADLVLTDVTMPGMDGLALATAIRDRWPETGVVVMTAFGTIPLAVQAIRGGALEFVTKPFDLDALKRTIAAALPKEAKRPKAEEPSFIAESPAMREVEELVRQVADARATVMIGGESGVGKEVVARALHRLGSRAAKPFAAVSCAAIPETLLEAELFGHEKGAFTGAHGGPRGPFRGRRRRDALPRRGRRGAARRPGQAPARVQEREIERLGANRPTKVDLRLVTATHRDLDAAVASGAFRLDLLYRLRVVEIAIPPLRDRAEDLLPLARLFLGRSADREGRGSLEVGPEASGSCGRTLGPATCGSSRTPWSGRRCSPRRANPS